MQTTKNIIGNYWDFRSNSYGCDRDKSIEVENKWFQVMNKLVANAPGKRAIDIGTGCGQFAFYLAKSGFNVTGIDISKNMIQQAKSNAQKFHLNIDFTTGDAEKLAFKDASFDVVVSRNLLWTLPNPEKALREWHRVLKPGGILIVSDGFWQNLTWKRIHLLGLNLIKGLLNQRNLISLRFFASYAKIKKSLPFYEGIHLDDVWTLMEKVHFKNIDSCKIRWNPYAHDINKPKKAPFFFIATAIR